MSDSGRIFELETAMEDSKKRISALEEEQRDLFDMLHEISGKLDRLHSARQLRRGVQNQGSRP